MPFTERVNCSFESTHALDGTKGWVTVPLPSQAAHDGALCILDGPARRWLMDELSGPGFDSGKCLVSLLGRDWGGTGFGPGVPVPSHSFLHVESAADSRLVQDRPSLPCDERQSRYARRFQLLVLNGGLALMCKRRQCPGVCPAEQPGHA